VIMDKQREKQRLSENWKQKKHEEKKRNSFHHSVPFMSLQFGSAVWFPKVFETKWTMHNSSICYIRPL
jgi:hypothetical protein